MAKKDARQLYNILSSIGNYVEDGNERGSIIGYGIMQALFSFQSTSGSVEERRFEEVKAIYSKLDSALIECRSNNGYHVLSDILKEVSPRMDDLMLISTNGDLKELKERSTSTDASLLDIVSLPLVSSSRLYQDRLRRNGSSLYDDITLRGMIPGRKNSLIADYNSVKKYFGVQK